MKKILFILSLISISTSYAQFEFTTDMSKAKKIVEPLLSYSVENSLYYIYEKSITVIDLKSGATQKVDFLDLNGKYLNSNYCETSTLNYGLKGLFSKPIGIDGNIQFLIGLLNNKKEIAIVKVTFNNKLKLIDEKLMESHPYSEELEKRFYLTFNIIKSNDETGETAYAEYIRTKDENDFIRVVCFDGNLDLVSSRKYNVDAKLREKFAYYNNHLKTIDVISDELILVNIDKTIYSFTEDGFQLFEMNVKKSMSSYILKNRTDKSFVLLGLNIERQSDNRLLSGGLFAVILEFDKNGNQQSENYISLPNEIFASCKSLMHSESSERYYGNAELREIIVDIDGKLRAFIITNPGKEKQVILGGDQNMTMLTFSKEGQLLFHKTVPVAIMKPLKIKESEKSFQVYYMNNEKCFDDNGNALAKCDKIIDGKNDILTVIEFDKSTNNYNHKIVNSKNEKMKLDSSIIFTSISGIEGFDIISLFKKGELLFIGKTL